MNNKSKIPSEEDFARAKQRMRERSEKESELKSAILANQGVRTLEQHQILQSRGQNT